VVAAAAGDRDLAPRADSWFAGLRELAAHNRFLFTVTDVTVVLRRPA
jgi:hypothetical protein